MSFCGNALRRLLKQALAAWLVLGLSLGPVQVQAAVPLPAAAEHDMVVSAHRLATQVGLDVLAKGGNAVDAAVAVGYALAVTFPEAGNLGGGGFMLVRFHDGRQAFIDFRETAPNAATPTMYQDADGKVIPRLSIDGYLAVGVPGTVAGLELARQKYGTRGRAELLAPAIALARDGFVLDQHDADFLATGAQDFAKDQASAAIFLHDGKPWQAGERLVQTDLANSLEAIALNGPQAFYDGPISRKIVAASKSHGGILAAGDFTAYRALERKPIECDYRGYHVISAPLPSSGGVVVCETLNILAGFDLGKLGFHSAQGVHYFAEALRLAYRDRNLNLGDPGFVTADVGRFTSTAYADSLRAGIQPDKATPSASLPAPGIWQEGTNTTHFSIVDREGNAVSLTYTLNNWFGARVTAPGTGILLNDEMDDFSAKPGASNMFGLVEGENNAIAPGKRPLSSMTPTIVTRDGKLFMVVGAPGGSRIPTAVLQVITNVIDYRMNLAEAVDAPRIHEQWLPDKLYYEKFALSADTAKALTAMGYDLQEMPYLTQIAAIIAGAPGIDARPIGRNVYYGVIDPRRPLGLAAGN